MAKIDVLLKRLCDMNGERLLLVSDSPCAISKDGKAAAGPVLNRQQIFTLFEEIAPPAVRLQLRQGETCKCIYRTPERSFNVGASSITGNLRVFFTPIAETPITKKAVELPVQAPIKLPPPRVLREVYGQDNHHFSDEDRTKLIEIHMRKPSEQLLASDGLAAASLVASVGVALVSGVGVGFDPAQLGMAAKLEALSVSGTRAFFRVIAPPKQVCSTVRTTLGDAVVRSGLTKTGCRLSCDMEKLMPKRTGLASIDVRVANENDVNEGTFVDVCVWAPSKSRPHEEAAREIAQHLMRRLP